MAQQPLFVVESEEKANMLVQLAGGDAVYALLRNPPVRVETLPGPDSIAGMKGANYSFTLNQTEEHLAARLEKLGERPVYLAMDGDSRGRYWVWLLQNYIKKHYPSVNCRVLALRGLTPFEFSSALEEAGKGITTTTDSIHIRAVCFSQLSGHLQRLIGTSNGPNKLPLTFNSLTTLFLMKNREDENRMYSPLHQWHAEAQLKVSGRDLRAVYKGRIGESAAGLESEEQCKALETTLSAAGLTVANIEKKKLNLPPPAPYLLAELLQEAFRVHRLSPNTVLQSLRRLFHGILCGDTRKGLISWYLPGNGMLSDDTLDRIDDQVVARFGENALSGKILNVSDGAILALWPEFTAADQQVLSRQERLLYEMIRLRTLASRMPAAAGQGIVCTLKCKDYVFEISDQQIEEKGHLAAGWQQLRKIQFGESPLSQLAEGQVIEIARVRCEHTSLYPPEQYTFETLFSDLADFSITVDDNLVRMLQFMMETGYIELDENGFLKPLANCRKVVNVLNQVFPSMQGVNLSAYFEQTAEEVISGRKTLASALNQVDQVLSIQGKPLTTPSVSSATLSTFQKKRQGRVSSSVIKTAAMPLDKEAAVGDALVEEHPSSAEEKAPPQHGGEELAVEGVGAGEETGPENISPPAFAEEPAASEQRPAPQEGGEFAPAAHDAGEPALEELAAPSQKRTDESSHVSPPTATADSPAEGTATDLLNERGTFSDQGPVPDEKNASGVEPVPPLPTAIALDEEEKVKSRPCPVCGRAMALRRDQYGQFFTCTGFPACRYAEPENSEALERMSCPVCAKGIVHVKPTPTGKMLYVCSEIHCEFMAWAKPHPIGCPSCGSPFLVEKKLPSGAVELRCPRAGCNFRQPFSSADRGTLEGRPEEKSIGLQKKALVRKVAGSSAPGGKKRVVRVVRRRK